MALASECLCADSVRVCVCVCAAVCDACECNHSVCRYVPIHAVFVSCQFGNIYSIYLNQYCLWVIRFRVLSLDSVGGWRIWNYEQQQCITPPSPGSVSVSPSFRRRSARCVAQCAALLLISTCRCMGILFCMRIFRVCPSMCVRMCVCVCVYMRLSACLFVLFVRSVCICAYMASSSDVKNEFVISERSRSFTFVVCKLTGRITAVYI